MEAAPIFLAIASRCNIYAPRNSKNPITRGQLEVVDNIKVFSGPNIDDLLESRDRHSENDCHLSESGQVKVGLAFANAIERHHNRAR